MLATACGGDDDTTTSSSGSAPAGGCAADSRKDIYTAGLAKPAGGLSVKLVQATPAPPAKGTNALTLEIVDAAGKPVEGATVVVTPFMPDHAHGSAVTPEVASKGGGLYEVSKVYLAMAGLWRLTVTVTVPGTNAADATFLFCLDG